MIMSKKHFIAIAKALSESTSVAQAARKIATALAQTNPAFNRAKFLEACGVSA